MTSVDATARVPGGTRPNLEGPFYRAAPLREDGDLFEGDPPAGTPVLHLSGRFTDAATGAPIPGAIVDLWHADHDGHYALDSDRKSVVYGKSVVVGVDLGAGRITNKKKRNQPERFI